MDTKIARKIFEAGAKLRNPSLFEQYDYLKRTEWLSIKDLNDIQLQNAERFLSFCGEHSPYFNRVFRESGFRPSILSSISEIGVLPESNKNTLIRENLAIHSTGLRQKLRLAETSGTSGDSLSFFRNERWDSMNRAALMRAYDWYNVKPWEKNGYLWGYNISDLEAKKVAFLDAMQNRFRLFKYSEAEIRNFCSKLQHSSFISGYSSMIFEVAKIVNKLGLGPLPLKLVKGTSEMILDAYNPESRMAFGKNISSEYGAAEAGLIAFECPKGGIHVNIENVILEQNDYGELLVTNLLSYSFPIIRYSLGDVVTLSEKTCQCGRNHPLLKNIIGRKGGNVYGNKNTYPALTFYYVFKNLALKENILLNYKARQEEKGKVELLIENKENEVFIKMIESELYKYFKDDIKFRIVFIDGFKIETKKSQYFETSL